MQKKAEKQKKTKKSIKKQKKAEKSKKKQKKAEKSRKKQKIADSAKCRARVREIGTGNQYSLAARSWGVVWTLDCSVPRPRAALPIPKLTKRVYPRFSAFWK